MGTFQIRITNFVANAGLTDDGEINKLVTGIVRYALTLERYRRVKAVAKELAIQDQFIEFKQRYLRNSFLVLGPLWRAMYYYASRLEHPKYKLFKVKKSDILFCLEYLSRKDLQALKKKAKEAYVEIPAYKKLCKQILKEFDPIIRYKVKGKLSFIFKYDRCVTEEDLCAELRVVTIKNVIKYSNEPNPLFIRKAVMQKLNHEIIDIIYKHTAQKRQYLVRTDEEQKKKTLVKVVDKNLNVVYKVVKQKFVDAKYATTVSSLDQPLGLEKDDETFHSIVPCYKTSLMESKENKNFVNKVLTQLECERLRMYVRILTSHTWPVSFEHHVKQQGITNHELKSIHKLSDVAKNYLNLTQYDLIKGVGAVLQKIGVKC